MYKTKVLTIKKEIIFSLLQFVALIGIAVVAPTLGNQAITGPIVNATLFIAVMLLNAQSAILVGLLPSVIALSVGLLPLVLSPMIPFIMIGNTILILVFNFLRKKNYWIGIIWASILKFCLLFISSLVVTNLIIKKEIVSQVATIMSWPQLLTALGGGIVAYIFLKSAKKI